MRGRVIIAVAILTTSAAAGGCGSSSRSTPVPPSSQTIANGSWALDSYRSGTTLVPAVAASGATIAFTNTNNVSGSTGCNGFAGTYTISGSQLTIKLGPMTQRACTSAAVMTQETAITQQLPQVTAYRIEGNTLTLSGNGNDLFVYSHVSNALPGTSWKVTGVNNGKGAVESTALTEKLTASFDDENTFKGFGGCNQLTGPYKGGSSGTVTIGPLTSTKKTCGTAADQLESQYNAALSHVTTYEIQGTTLTMRDASNATQVTAQRS